MKRYTLGEEIFNSVSHGVGIFFAIAGCAVLIVLSAIYADFWAVISSVIYGICMLLLYTASTLYHSFTNSKVKEVFRVFDHCTIFLLIAGSYTPFLLVPLRSTAGWIIFTIIWSAALIGTLLKLTLPTNGAKLWSVGLYLCMGWAVVIVSKQLFSVLPTASIVFLILGGLSYTLGIFFYLWKSKKYTHSVWHCFVLVGTIMHFFAVLFGCVFI